MKIENIVMTCSACPSQWNITLKDGRMVYVHYRWGALVMTISDAPTQNVHDAVGGEEIYRWECVDVFDGCMSQEELNPHLEKAGIKY